MIAAAGAVAACSESKTACLGVSDKAAVAKVIDLYAKEPASTRGDPTQMQLSRQRIAGIGRVTEVKGDGMTQVWFAQDDHTLTVATLSGSCEVQFRPGLSPAAIKEAAIPVHSPVF
jgi:hypothetical protein